MKLIDADEMLKQMREVKEIGMKMFKFKETGANPVEVVADALIDCVLDATAVDAVEVVRCKDCKFSDYDCICVVCEDRNHVVCSKKLWQHVTKNHFCAYGERKEEES